VTGRDLFTMPTLTVGKDRDGLPHRITIPGGSSKRVPLIVDTTTVGWVEPSGDVLSGDLGLFALEWGVR